MTDPLIHRPDALAQGLADDAIAARLRSGQWTRTQRGVYVPREATVDARTAARAAVMSAGSAAVASGATAAAVWGIDVLRAESAAEVTVPRKCGRKSRRGLHFRYSDIPDDEVVDLGDGLLVTSVRRTLVDVVCRSDRWTGVWACEHAIRQDLVTLSELADLADRFRDHRRPLARRRLALVEPRSESPLETGVRLPLIDIGLVPQIQFLVVDENGHAVARLDLAIEEARIGIEADGREVHGSPAALYADRWRQNALITLGWRILRFTWTDALSPAVIWAQVRQLLRA